MQQITRKRMWISLATILWVVMFCFLGCGNNDDLTKLSKDETEGTQIFDPGVLGELEDIGDFDNNDGRLGYTQISAIDASGNVVGQSNFGNPSRAAFVWESDTKTMTYLGIHDSPYDDYYGFVEDDDDNETDFIYSTAVAIFSNDGTVEVIGNSITEGGNKRAFYWHEDTFDDLPPMYYEIDFDVYDDDGNETHYEGYVVTNFSEAVAMNDAYILVNADDKDGSHAYYWDKQSYKTIRVYDKKYEDYDDVDGDNDDDNDDDDEDVDEEPAYVEIEVPEYQLLGNKTVDDSEAVAINANNQAIINIGDGDRVVFYDIDTGNIETLEPLSGADEIFAVAINDDGNVAGISGDDAFFWKNGNMTICGNLCEDQADGTSVTTAINNDNQVVGYATNDDGDVHAFVWQYEDGESVITDLGTLGGANSYAGAINDNGVVIGYCETGDTYAAGSLQTDVYHACAWYEGALYDLGVITNFIEADDADFPFSICVTINNSDRIAGNFLTINDFSRGFIIDATFP